MNRLSRRSAAVQTMLRELGNPYAAEQMFDPAEESAQASESYSARELLRRSENPHAFSYYLGEEEASTTVAMPSNQRNPSAGTGKLSKEGFRSECRTIFRRYIPALERGKLRPHHQAFIVRHENRPATVRHALATQLRRYDLSNVPGLTSQFNRERDEFTEEKLRAIERAAGVTG